MSVQRFEVVLKLAKLDDNDRVWFGRWLRRYAVFLREPENVSLLVSQDSVKQFCRMLLSGMTLAWQRLQAVRAIEFYRNQVLETAERHKEVPRLRVKDVHFDTMQVSEKGGQKKGQADPFDVFAGRNDVAGFVRIIRQSAFFLVARFFRLDGVDSAPSALGSPELLAATSVSDSSATATAFFDRDFFSGFAAFVSSLVAAGAGTATDVESECDSGPPETHCQPPLMLASFSSWKSKKGSL